MGGGASFQGYSCREKHKKPPKCIPFSGHLVGPQSVRIALGELSVGAGGGYHLLAIVKATFATNAVSKGGGIAMLAGVGLHRVEPVGAGKSAEVAASAGLSFLRYCHSGADNRLKRGKIQIFSRIFPGRPRARL